MNTLTTRTFRTKLISVPLQDGRLARRSILGTMRWMTSRRNNTHHNDNTNPYRILGIPPTSSFQTVQKAFVKLAFQHHPDTAGNVSADFVLIRQAFERIRNAKQGVNSLVDHPSKNQGGYYDNDDNEGDGNRSPQSDTWTEADFLKYFHRQTGVRLSSEQREELVDLYRTRVPGGYYGGHSWDLARRLVAEQDAFLRNMQSGGSTEVRKGIRRHSGAFSAELPEEETSGGNNLRRKRKR